MTATISLTLDGHPLQVRPGTTVLEAALANGIDIPRLCYHPELTPSGGCRLCLVQVAGRPAPQASCGLQCEAGMVVDTRTPELEAMRKDLLDLFLSDHPLRCAVCDKNGACDLQKYAYEYGLAETSLNFELSRPVYQDDNAFFVRDHQYCILCGRCVRVCDEVVGANAIEIAGRGFASRVATPFDELLVNSNCVFCGSCVQVCPTAALMPRTRIGQGREWELRRTRTICGYCGVGCAVEYAAKDNHLLYAQGFPEAPVNGEFLCVKGRYGWDFAANPGRLTEPLVRKDLAQALGLTDEPWTMPTTPVLQNRDEAARQNYVPVTWETALDLVARKLAETVRAHGADAVAGLTSARCTNEENFLFQKLMRATLWTNNVDHCARLCHASSVTGLGMAFGSGAMTNPIRDVRHADCLLITGSNTAESHPVIAYEVVRAVKGGAHLVIIDPRRIPLVEHATLWLQPKPGTDGVVLLALAHVIVREGWADEAFIAARTEGYAEFAAALAPYTPERAALESGVPADDIVRAARLYALGERVRGASAYPDARGHAMILYAMGITQRTNGTDLVLSLANLALLTGQVGKPSTGINPLRGQSNVQGACDMGGLPNVLPGYQPVTDDAKRKAVAAHWGLPDLPSKPGLTVVELMTAAEARQVRALYVMGENPMLSDPNLTHVEHALRTLDFLVVQDIFMSETAQLAHVILPAAAWLEKDGTKTNTERRVQLLRPVLPAPGQARPDWWIVAELGKRLEAQLGLQGNVRWTYSTTSEIADEIAAVTPSYRGIRHARLEGEGLTWPCPEAAHPGTPILHTERFTRGLGKFHPITARAPAEMPDAEFPLVLSTGRVLYHYHTGTMTRRSDALAWRESRGWVEINAVDAAAAGVRDATAVVLRSRRGQVRTQARVSDNVPPGVVFLAFHWKEAPANLLTQDFALDPLAKIPEYKLCTVRLENPRGGQG